MNIHWPNLLIIFVTVGITLTAFNHPRLHSKLLLYPSRLGKPNWLPLLGYGFIHANGPHLFINMYTLYLFGSTVSVFFNLYLGNPYIFFFFYLSAIVISVIPTVIQKRHKPNYFYLGASGAVTAVLFAYVFITPWANIYIMIVPVPVVLLAAMYLAYSIYQGKTKGSFNYSVHVTGAIYGLLVMSLISPYGFLGFVQRVFNF